MGDRGSVVVPCAPGRRVPGWGRRSDWNHWGSLIALETAAPLPIGYFVLILLCCIRKYLGDFFASPDTIHLIVK